MRKTDCLSKTALYTLLEIKTLLNTYIASKNLINQNDQAYINLDELFYACVSWKTKGRKAGGEEEAPPMKFMKRDELAKSVTEKMQSWYEIRVEGRETVRKCVFFFAFLESSPFTCFISYN